MNTLESIFERVEAQHRVVYRDPFDEPYADPARMTKAQRTTWNYMIDHKDVGSMMLAMIGAKGSSKTHFGAGFAFYMGQKYPESVGCVISNTYQQTKDNAGMMFLKMANFLGFNSEFFTTKKIKGQQLTNVYVVDLDAQGFNTGKNFYLLVRSFDAVNKLEGIEIDWLWVEEIQDAERESFQTVLSRIRGKGSPNYKFIAGMPREELHWMYTVLPKQGALEAEKRAAGEEVVTPRGTRRYGIMVEPTVFENQKNLPPGYVDDLYATYDKDRAEWYIFGRRTSLKTNKVAYAYQDHLHRTGRMSKMLCKYDQALPIILSFDFNVSWMWVTAWQIKPWNDAWDSEDYALNDNGTLTEIDTGRIVNALDIAAPDREVLAQIDEFEVTIGGTRTTCAKVIEKYQNHLNGFVVLGDATGDREYSSAHITDWQIISEAFARLPHVEIIKGLVTTSDYKKGVVKYSNPNRQDTINALNTSLQDARGKVHICFLPVSRYESGGAARSAAMLERKPDGRIDDTVDRSEDDEQYRTHPFDTVRYVNWWWRGDVTAVSGEEYNQIMANPQVQVDERIYDDEFIFGGSWEGIFT